MSCYPEQAAPEPAPDRSRRRRRFRPPRLTRPMPYGVDLTELGDRDHWTCWVCGGEVDPKAVPGSPNAASVDHVIPRSRGGRSVWENIVASCAPCNRRKGNRLPQEIRMRPKRNPRPPGPTVFIRIAAPRTPEAWEPYLLAA